MKKIYLLTLCIASVVQGFSQEPAQSKRVVTPSLENSIPVKAGDAFTIRTTATRIGKKTSVLQKVVQVIGTGAAVYQSTRTTIGKGAKERLVNNRDWIIPAGIAIAFTADKIPGIHSSSNTFLKYTLYSKDGKSILHTGITKLSTKALKQQGGILLEGIAYEDGFLVPEIIGKPFKGLANNNIVVNIDANKSGYSDKIKPQVIKPVTLVPEIRTGSIALPVLKSLSFVTPEPAESVAPVREAHKKTIITIIDAKKRLVPVVPGNSKGTVPVPGNSELQQGIKPVGKPVSKPKQKQPGIFFPLLYYKKEEFGVVDDEEEPGVKLFKKNRGLKLIDPWLRFINAVTPSALSMESDDSDDGYGTEEEGEEGGCLEDEQGGEDPGDDDPGDGEQDDPGDGCLEPGDDDPGGGDPGGDDPGGDDPGGDDPGGDDPGGGDPWGEGGDPWGDDYGWDDGGWDDGIFDDLGWDGGYDDGGSWDDGGSNPPDNPPEITIDDIQGFRGVSLLIADMEIQAGITAGNLPGKLIIEPGNGGATTATTTDPATTSFKIHIGKDQAYSTAILTYAHELANAKNIAVSVGYLNTAKNSPKTPANRQTFLNNMAKVEAYATYSALLVAVELGLDVTPDAQACLDKVKASVGPNATVTPLDALNFVKDRILDGTLKGADGNPIINHYGDIYDNL